MSSPLRIPPAIAAEIDRLATAVGEDVHDVQKTCRWQMNTSRPWHVAAAAVLEDGPIVYPGIQTAMAALGKGSMINWDKRQKLLAFSKRFINDTFGTPHAAKLYHAGGTGQTLALRSVRPSLNANLYAALKTQCHRRAGRAAAIETERNAASRKHRWKDHGSGPTCAGSGCPRTRVRGAYRVDARSDASQSPPISRSSTCSRNRARSLGSAPSRPTPLPQPGNSHTSQDSFQRLTHL